MMINYVILRFEMSDILQGKIKEFCGDLFQIENFWVPLIGI